MSPAKEPVCLSPTQLFHPLPQHHVIICTPCRYAVPPSAIPRHLKEIHHIYRARRRPFLEYVSKFDLKEPQDVVAPDVHQFPVAALPIYDGLQCNTCAHLCISEKRMQNHWRSTHHQPGRANTDWHHVPLQTFFRGNLLRYFTGSEIICKFTDTSQADGTGKDVLQVTCFNSGLQATKITFQIPELLSADHVINGEPGVIPLQPFEQFLLRHFENSTSKTIATDIETDKLWRVSIIHMAYHHQYLMDALLALAALHLAHGADSEHQNSYSLEARKLQDRAMIPFQAAVAHADESNCHAILSFTHLLVLYSFATEKQDEKLLIVIENKENFAPNWLHFLQSGCSMLTSVWTLLESGPYQALTREWEKPIDLPRTIGTMVSDILDTFLQAVPSPSDEDAWSEDECIDYREAASSLALALACSRTQSQPCTIWDILRIWPIRLSQNFMHMLSTSHPGALILLAHYSILLKDIEVQWYFEGRATRLIQTIVNKLAPKWHKHINEPLYVINLTQSEDS